MPCQARFSFPEVCKGVTVIAHSTESISDDVSKVKSLINKGLPESTCLLVSLQLRQWPCLTSKPRDELVCERLRRSVDMTLISLHLLRVSSEFLA